MPSTRIATSTGQLGSMGMAGQRQKSAGGGRIVILADSLSLNGTSPTLEANARPFFDANLTETIPGGSGGYIYVQTAN